MREKLENEDTQRQEQDQESEVEVEEVKEPVVTKKTPRGGKQQE